MTLPRWLATMLVSAVCLAGAATSTTHAGTADQDVATIAAENNDFAVDLYGQLAATPGNLFFSPYSIDSALAMTLNGARTETAAQMRTVLHSSLSPRRMNAAFSALSSELDNIPQVNGTAAYDLAVANALYGQSSFTFNPGFLQTLQQDYGAPLNLVDFKQNADQAAQTIDDWVAQQTNNKIQDLFAPGSIPDNTRLVLVNAIYFLGNWDNKFDPNQTENQPFHLGNGQPDVTVPIMRQTEVLSYMENDQAQVLDIPYVAEKLSMVILLPRSVDGLSALESKLTAGKLSRWMDQLSGYQVSVFLPKFQLTSQFELAPTLGDMGMVDAFDNNADFSGITTSKRIEINQVVHKAFVDVSEAGTEAAAATGVGFGVDIVGSAIYPPANFRADHPFIFLIRDNVSGAILFMGRVTNPND